MAALSVQVPYPVFYDRDGQPLDNGNIYIGVANLDPVTNPLQVYYDEALTIPASQPLKTSNGYIYRNGTPTQLYVNATDFSITVNDSKNTFVYSFPEGTGIGVGAASIEYDPPFAGALTSGYTASDKLSQYVSVKDFGAVGDDVTDDTAAIQAALDTGLNVDLVGGQYQAANLTLSTNVQALFSSQGFARITKNANGPILAVTGDDCLLENIGFRGDAAAPVFTGDNVVVTGNAVTILNCGSRWAYGRSLKISGNAPTVIGSGDIWQTADSTVTGYDIEISNAGTTIAYPQLIGIVTSQSTGGILLTNTGSHVLSSGQIGKLTINTAGGPPAGVNGGMTTNMRIVGDVLVSQSTARFVGNQFGAVAVTLGAGTSGISIDQSNSFQSGSTAVNNGNSNNVIIRQTSGGSFNTFKFGGDASNATMDVYSANGDTGQFGFTNGAFVGNNKPYAAKSSGGTLRNLAYISGADVNFLGNDSGDTVVVAATDLVLAAGGNGRWSANATSFYPRADNSYSLGTGTYRPTVIYAVTGTINTSDANEKHGIRPLSEKEKAVGSALRGLIRAYKWNSGAEEIYVGVIAQEVIAAFEAEGLNASDYGIIDASGDRLGVRYDQVFAFIIGAL